MRPLAVIVATLFALPAHAARHELSFVYQGLAHGDPMMRDLRLGEGLHAFGVRGGAAVLRDRHRLGLVVDAGWTRGGIEGARTVYRQGGASWETDLRFTADTFTVGLKADVDVGNVFYPYLHVQGGLIAGGTRAWDDVLEERAGGVAPVGQFTAGFELMVPDQKLGWPVTFAVFVEAGYQAAGPLGFQELGGAIDLSGAVVRSGIGLRM